MGGCEVNCLQAQRVDLACHNADVGTPVEHAARHCSMRFFLKVKPDARVVRQKTRQNFWQKISHGRGVGKGPANSPS
jgi:hypothetical protein